MVGESLVRWLWGGFSIREATLSRFAILHFLLPLLFAAGVGAHLIFLHETGSRNPMGLKTRVDKIPFHPYFTSIDAAGFAGVLTLCGAVRVIRPWQMGDPENFLPADPITTPIHIKPEWYFLFAYAI